MTENVVRMAVEPQQFARATEMNGGVNPEPSFDAFADLVTLIVEKASLDEKIRNAQASSVAMHGEIKGMFRCLGVKDPQEAIRSNWRGIQDRLKEKLGG